MTTLRTAAQQALEAMDKATRFMSDLDYKKLNEAITALRAALAEPDPFNLDWDQTKSLDENFREHLAEIQRLRVELLRVWLEAPEQKPLQEQVQEPVAWLTPRNVDSYPRTDFGYETGSKTDYGAFPVYTAPPQRKPLTDEEMRTLADKHLSCQPESYEVSGVFDLIRAIERAHGIGGQDD